MGLRPVGQQSLTRGLHAFRQHTLNAQSRKTNWIPIDYFGMSTVTIPAASAKTIQVPLNKIQTAAVVPAALLLLAFAIYITQAVRGRQAWLFLVGAAAGVILYHAAFGFTSAWRAFITDRRGN